MEQRVEVSKTTLVGLVVALTISLMAVAFLLGRSSVEPLAQPGDASPKPLALASSGNVPARPEAPLPDQRLIPARQGVVVRPQTASATARTSSDTAAPASTSSRQESSAEPAEPASPASYPTNRPTKRTAPQKPDPPAEGPRKAATAPASAAPKSHPAERRDAAAVRRYFQQLDSAMAGTQSLSDANGVATQLLQQSLQGDTSGFDQLLSSSELALDQVEAVTVPPSCKEHHKLLTGQLKDGIAMLRQVKSATTSMDTSGLAALSQRGKEMQTDTARLQRLEKELRASI